MKITEKQLLMLMATLGDSVKCPVTNCPSPFSYDREARLRVYNDIMHQQSDEVKTIEELKG